MDNLETYMPNREALHHLISTIESAGNDVEAVVRAYVEVVAEELGEDEVEADIQGLIDYVKEEMNDFDDYVDTFQEAREDDTRQRIQDLKSGGY